MNEKDRADRSEWLQHSGSRWEPSSTTPTAVPEPAVPISEQHQPRRRPSRALVALLSVLALGAGVGGVGLAQSAVGSPGPAPSAPAVEGQEERPALPEGGPDAGRGHRHEGFGSGRGSDDPGTGWGSAGGEHA